MSTKNSLPAPVPKGEWPSDERGGYPDMQFC